MRKSRFARGHVLGLASSALVALALIGCGSVTRAGSEATEYAIRPAPFCVAPVDGSPEEAALADGHCPNSWWHAAPIDGTPEQTVADNGREGWPS